MFNLFNNASKKYGATDLEFLEKVKKKQIHDGNIFVGTFSHKGDKIAGGSTGDVVFVKAESSAKGIYSYEVDSEQNYIGIEYRGASSKMYINKERHNIFTDTLPKDILKVSIK